jgi:hypothetical protein
MEKFIENPLLKSFPAAQMRFLMGDEVSDMLGIPAVSFEKKLVGLIPNSIMFRQDFQKNM